MNDHELDGLFGRYRGAIPDPEPSGVFMPRLWEAIEARRTFKTRFGRVSRVFVTAAGAIWLVIVTLLIVQSGAASSRSSDFDILADSHAAESINLDTLSAAPGSDRK